MASLDDVAVNITANASAFESTMRRVETDAKRAFSTIEGAASTLNNVMGALGVGLSAGVFVAAIKGAIDYADRLNDLSQTTGLAVETLGGLGYAAKTAGVDLDAVAKGIVKLDSSMVAAAEGNKEMASTLSKLGVSLKDGDQALFKIADSFAKMQDGPEKAALAVRTFGKAGAEMIPLLNQGGEELRKLIDEFNEYGGVSQETASRADKFNDTLEKIKMISGSLWQNIAATALPTLQSLADKFVGAKNDGESFRVMADGVNTALKMLGVVAIGVVASFKAVGSSIGATVAALMQAASGNFSGAWNTLKEGFGDFAGTVKKAISDARDVWNTSTDGMATAADNMARKVKPAFENVASSAGKASKAAKEFRDAAAEVSKETEYLAKAALKAAEALEAQQRAIADGHTAMATFVDAEYQSIEAYERQTDAIGKTEEALAALAIQRAAEIRDMRLMAGMGDQAVALYDKQVAAINRRLAVNAADAAQGSAQKMADEFTKQSDALTGSLADAIMRGFESGKNFAKNFLDTLQNWFKQTILRPVIQAIVSPVSAGIAGMLGSGTASAGGLGGAGSAASWLSGGSAAGWLGNVGIEGGAAGAGLAGMLDGAGFASLASGVAGLGSVLSVAVPIVGALAGIASLFGLFDKKPKLVSGQFQVGGANFEDSISTPSAFGALGFADANTMRFSGEEGAAFSRIIGQVLDAAAAQMDESQIASTAAKLNATIFEAMEGELTTEAFIKAYGRDILQQTVAVAFDELNPRLGELMRGFSGTIEEVTAYAGELLQVNALIEDSATALGGIFEGLDVDDIIALSDAFGGLDQMIAGTSEYINLFYTDAEKLGMATAALQAQFAELGVAMPETNEAFRQLIEALRNAEQPNLDLIAALIKLAPAFAQVTNAATAAIEEIAEAVTIDLTPAVNTSGYTRGTGGNFSFEKTWPDDPAERLTSTGEVWDPFGYIASLRTTTNASADLGDSMTELQRLTAALVNGYGGLNMNVGAAAPGGSQTTDAGLTAALAGMTRQIDEWQNTINSLQGKAGALADFRSSLLTSTRGFVSPGAQYAEALRAMTTAGDEDFVGAAQDFLGVSERNARTRFEYMRDVGTASAQSLSRETIINSQIEYYNVQIALQREILRTLGQIREDLDGQAEETKAANVAIAKNTGLTARQLSRWDGDGMPAERVV